MKVMWTLDQSNGNKLLEFFTAYQRNCGKLTFSVACVCLFTGASPHIGLQIVQTCSKWIYCTGTHPLNMFKHCSIETSLHRALLDMFKFVQLGRYWTDTPPATRIFKPIHYESQIVDEWAVRILQKCLLVSYVLMSDCGKRLKTTDHMSYNPNEFGCKFSWRMLGKLNLKNIKNVSIWFQLIPVLKPSNNWVSKQNLQCATKHKLDVFPVSLPAHYFG